MIFYDYDVWEGRLFGKWVGYKGSLLYSCEQLDEKAIKEITEKIKYGKSHVCITKIAEAITNECI